MTKRSDQLFGGLNEERPGRSAGRTRRPEADAVPPQVGYRFLAVLVLVGGLFTAAASWRVYSVFHMRDLEMEAGRLQSVMQRNRDRTKTLLARVAHLQRGEILKATAEESLGMAEPLPGAMETVVVATEAQTRWQRAAESVREGSREVSMD